MRVVGVDTHKATVAACLIDDVGLVVAEASFRTRPPGSLPRWAWLRDL
jgi:hypothetical protein